jgi:phosphoglycolate phosphatase-like HAD superfamily hydrolase
MRFVVFDLDQTLIRGEDVDWRLWLASCEEMLGVEIPMDQDWTRHPIHTDHGLLESLSRQARGCGVTPAERIVYERILYARLEAALQERPDLFVPVAGAAQMLAVLAEPAGIATGNLHRATLLKLASSGLDRFGLPCVCSDDGPDRPALVRGCLEQLGWRPGERAISVGDGVWDIAAARALGIAFVGIAQSDAHEERLRARGAGTVLRDFSDISAFRDALDAADVPDPAR